MPDLKKNTPDKELYNSEYLLKDLLQGDNKILGRPEFKNLDTDKIKLALQYLTTNPNLDARQQSSLIQESWRINYKSKPPTPEEFLSEKYLGPAYKQTYDRVKKVFLDFMNPSNSYRNLILYPHIGWGKALHYNELVYTPTGPVKIKDIKVHDWVCTPRGSISEVIQVADFPQEKVYKLTTTDKRSSLACGNHYWQAAYEMISDYEPDWRIITTEELIKDQKAHPEHAWFLPNIKSVFFREKDHIVSPYQEGLLLGSSKKRAPNQIPEEYLYDSQEHRLKLLEGLLDSEMVHYDEDTHKKYLETDKLALYKSVVNLARSLGRAAHLTIKYADRKFLFQIEISKKSESPKYIFIEKIEPTSLKGGRCIETSDSGHLFITNDFLVTHNSYLSVLINLYITVCCALMRDPWKFFGLNPATMLVQLLVSYSLKKSSELLLEPYMGVLEASPFFEKVHTMESMAKKSKDFDMSSSDHIEKLFYTTAGKTSELTFSGHMNIKLASNIQALLGLSVVACTMSELNFFSLAGKALYCQEKVLTDTGPKAIQDIKVGDRVKTPYGYSLVTYIPYEHDDPLYEVKFSDGRTVKCHENHLWNVRWHEGSGSSFQEKTVETRFMIEHPQYAFYIPTWNKGSYIEYVRVLSIRKISDSARQKCISIEDPRGLFILENGIITHNSPEYIMRIYNDSRSRVQSRMKNNYYGRTILDSSPNSLDSAIDDYVINFAPKDPSNYIVEGSMWKWEPEDYRMTPDNIFKIYIGGKGQPPKLLEPGDPMLSSALNTADEKKIIDAPIKDIYGTDVRQFFRDDLVKALKDRAGIPSGSADNLIYDYKKIENIFDARLKNIYTHIYASSENMPADLIWDQVEHIFFKKVAGQNEFYYKPRVPRCISIDQSISSDVTCIAMTHPERYKDTGEFMYVVDFTIVIAPNKGGRINLEAITCFIEDLRNKGNVVVDHVSYDTFQSEASIQRLMRDKFDVEKLSVDQPVDRYLDLLHIINTNRIRVGRNLYVKNNLKSLHMVHTKGGRPKVDHDNSRPVITTGDSNWETSHIGDYAKDAADAICASIQLCKKYYDVVEESWDPTYLDRISASSDSQEKEANKKLQDFLRRKGLTIA